MFVSKLTERPDPDHLRWEHTQLVHTWKFYTRYVVLPIVVYISYHPVKQVVMSSILSIPILCKLPLFVRKSLDSPSTR